MLSLFITLSVTPLVLLTSLHYNIIDVPDSRKIHSEVTPRLGGLGIFFSFLLCFYFLGEFNNTTISILLSSFIIVITGMLDDIFDLSPKFKLFGQFLAATIVIFYGKMIFSFSQPLYIEIIFTYFWILGVTNAVNLIDGMDGLASGLSLIGFVSLGVVYSLSGNVYYSVLCFVLAGGVLGFLRFNLPPSIIFMGDTGSLFLGFIISVLSVVITYQSGTAFSVFIPVMFVSIPVLDTFLAIVRRVCRGTHPFKADKEHLHHRLLNLHFTPTQTLLIFYFLSAILGTIAVIFNNKKVVFGFLIVFMILYGFIIILKALNFFNLNDFVLKINKNSKKPMSNTNSNDAVTKFTNLINIAIVSVTYLILIVATIKKTEWKYDEIIFILVFVCVIGLSFLVGRFLNIKNEFVNFLIFWLFYYFSWFIVSNSLIKNFYLFYLLLIILLLTKIIVSKRAYFFFVNPMEILALYGLFMINFTTNMTVFDNLLILLLTAVLYYPNKAVFSKSYRHYKYHLAVLLAVVILMPYKFYLSFYYETAGVGKHYYGGMVSPLSYKNTIERYLGENKLASAREIVLKYQENTSLPIFEKMIFDKASEVYAELIIDELTKGNLNLSNKYLQEYLNMYPETVSTFYDKIKPFFRQISGVSFEGADDIKFAGIPLNKIFDTYSATIKEVALSQRNSGFKSRSDECLKVASLLKRFTKAD